MEGKWVTFKVLVGINAFPLCIATQDKEEIIQFVKAIHPVFGAINMEELESPKVLEIVETTGRSDFPNQVNNAVVSPPVLRALLDLQVRELKEDVVVAIANAIASLVEDELLNEHFIISKVNDPRI